LGEGLVGDLKRGKGEASYKREPPRGSAFKRKPSIRNLRRGSETVCFGGCKLGKEGGDLLRGPRTDRGKKESTGGDNDTEVQDAIREGYEPSKLRRPKCRYG